MEKSHFYALTTVVALSLALVVTYGSAAPQEVSNTRTRVLSLAENSQPDLPMFIFGTPPGIDYFSETEVEMIEVAIEEYSATTTTAPPSRPKSPPPTSPPPTSPTTTAPSGTTTTTMSGGFNASYESEFFSRINSFRQANGLAALVRDGSLNARARDWAAYLGDIGTLKHSNLSTLLPPWTAAGENLAAGGSVGGLFDGLKASATHRSIMLGDFTHVGIGVWVDGNGTMWAVHVFTRS